jgi:hypothetical protein
MYSYNLLPQKILIFCLKYENYDTFDDDEKDKQCTTGTAMNISKKYFDFPTRVKLG